MSKNRKTYTEFSRLSSYDERFDYLRLGGDIGFETFGLERDLNQKFYTSREWRQVRHHVIARDNSCDLGVDGYDIYKGLHIHHMNPMTPWDLIHGNDEVLDPEFLISTSHTTHNAIHFGNGAPPRIVPVERRPGDTKLW